MLPWTEHLHLGRVEWENVLLAHAIILGIALWRYALRPWWLARRAPGG